MADMFARSVRLGTQSVALILPAIGTLLLGIFPSWVLDFPGKSSGLVK